MATNIFDPSGNLNYRPNIWQQQDWQTAGTVPMTGGPAPAGDWWSQNAPPGAYSGAPQGNFGLSGAYNPPDSSTPLGPIAGPYATSGSPQGSWQTALPGGGQGGGFSGQSVDPNAIKQYAASRGYNMNDQEAQYWVDKWPELYARGQQLGDPGYAFTRLSQADQWTAPAQRAAGGVDSGAGGAGQMGTFQADPGYQFRLGEGLNALQRGAAARGTLLTGGTQKALERYAQDYASGEFGNVFNRNLSLANLGMGATSGIVNAAGQYGQQAANAVTGQGNAAAAGTVGAGNAWMGTLGQLGQLGAGYAAGYPYGRPQNQPSPYPPTNYPNYGPGY